MQLNLDLGIKRAVHNERGIEGKKMGLFFSHSKKGPVFEHFTKYGSATKFVINTITSTPVIPRLWNAFDLLTFINFAG
ncbi:MAG: hypothetical protein WBZ36_02520 [Candidatus Nitrosopolaris sp.]|jgi:hypothetical protein